MCQVWIHYLFLSCDLQLSIFGNMLSLVSLQFSLSFAPKDHFDVMRQFYSRQIVKQSWRVFEVQNRKAVLQFIVGGQRWA